MPGLQDLPPETLNEIIGYLRYQPSPRFSDFSDGSNTTSSTLRNLSLTSKTLSEAVIPLLYETIDYEIHHISSLINTLLQHPEYASHIQSIRSGCSFDGLSLQWRKQFSYLWRENSHSIRMNSITNHFDEAVRQYKIFVQLNSPKAEDEADKEGGHEYDDGEEEADEEDDDDDEDEDEDDETNQQREYILEELLITLAANVKYLSLSLPYFRSFDRLDTLIDNSTASKSTTTGKMAPAHLNHSIPILSSLESLHASHEDTEGGFDLGVLARFLAVPTLHTLSLHMCDGYSLSPEVSFANICSLEMSFCVLEADDFTKLILALPYLERLSYNSGGSTVSDGDEVSRTGIVDALAAAPCASTLQSLRLDLGDRFDFEGDMPGGGLVRASSMQKLQKLHSLDIFTEGVEGAVETEDEALWLDRCPAGLRTLALRGVKPGTRFRDLAKLYKLASCSGSAAGAKLKELRNIAVWQGMGNGEDLEMADGAVKNGIEKARQEFEKNGVKFTFA